MAKSLRSKWRRKCRSVKRERYGKKELDRLKKTLGIDENQSTNSDIAMAEISEIATITTAKEIKEKQSETKNDPDMDSDTIKKKFNTRTLRDENGSYPIWLHPRKIKKSSKKGKKGGKKGKNTGKSKK